VMGCGFGERLNDREKSTIAIVLVRLTELRDNPYLNPEDNGKEFGLILDMLMAALSFQQ